MREVNYVVLKSLIYPKIYAGIIRERKDGTGVWVTRGEVTNQAKDAVLEYYAQIADEKLKEADETMRALILTYENVKGFDIKIEIRKMEAAP